MLPRPHPSQISFCCCRPQPIQVDCTTMDPFMTELFGRGSREGLLHWLRDGTLVINNVHKVCVRGRRCGGWYLLGWEQGWCMQRPGWLQTKLSSTATVLC